MKKQVGMTLDPWMLKEELVQVLSQSVWAARSPTDQVAYKQQKYTSHQKVLEAEV